ncbi:MAG: hypothetical protein R6U19_10505 [Bacteroidales bacterium]
MHKRYIAIFRKKDRLNTYKKMQPPDSNTLTLGSNTLSLFYPQMIQSQRLAGKDP